MKNGVPERLKVTLKRRGGDAADMVGLAFTAQATPALTDEKYEVDVVQVSSSTELVHKYSRSANVELGKFKKIADLMDLYPVLKQLQHNGHPKIKKTDMKLRQVNGFTAFETVVDVGSITIAGDTCDASFSFWYKTKQKTQPMVAEFSYVCEKQSDQATELIHLRIKNRAA